MCIRDRSRGKRVEEVSYLGPRDDCGASPSLKQYKVHHFKKEKFKIFPPEGPRENVFPGPAVALDVPVTDR